MSNGKKFNTPKKFWHNMRKKTRRPSYAKCYWRISNPHVMGRGHKKFKWFFRNKKWFKNYEGDKLGHQKMNMIELWFWD